MAESRKDELMEKLNELGLGDAIRQAVEQQVIATMAGKKDDVAESAEEADVLDDELSKAILIAFAKKQKMSPQVLKWLRDMDKRVLKKVEIVADVVKCMYTCCTPFKGSDGAMYMNVDSATCPELNGIYSLTDLGATEKSLADVIREIYSKQKDKEFGKELPTETYENACRIFLSIGRVHGEDRQVAKHVAHVRRADGSFEIHIDRATKSPINRVIRATGLGPPTLEDYNGEPIFRHMGSSGELPEPDYSKTYADLGPLLSTSEEQKRLIFLILVVLLLLEQEPLIVVVVAPRNTGKTVLIGFMRGVYNPSEKLFSGSTFPADMKELQLQGYNTFLLGYDNIAHRIDSKMHQVICMIGEGMYLRPRMLYENSRVLDVFVQNQMILGSEENPLRGEAEHRRALQIKLDPRVEDDKSRVDIEEIFRKQHPAWLGAVVNAANGALANADMAKGLGFQMLAEFKSWAVAVAVGLGWDPIETLALIDKHHSLRSRPSELEDYPFLFYVSQFLAMRHQQKYVFIGTPSQLLGEVSEMYETYEQVAPPIDPRVWPQNARNCAYMLNRHEKLLFEHNIKVETQIGHIWDGSVGGNLLMLEKFQVTGEQLQQALEEAGIDLLSLKLFKSPEETANSYTANTRLG